MRTFEIKGFWGFVLFTIVSLFLISIAVAIPVSVTWVTWNALVGEVMKGPMIEFWQAAILTAAFGVLFKIVFQPKICLNIKRVKSAEDLEKQLRKLNNEQDPTQK